VINDVARQLGLEDRMSRLLATPKFIVWKGLETYFSPPLFYGNRFLFAPKKTLFLNMAMMFHPVPRWAMGL